MSSRSMIVSSLLVASALAAGAGAQPFLVRDIHPGIGPGVDSRPQLIETDRGFAFLIAEDPDHGRELWKTDGTAAGTRLVRDICAGACSSDPRAEWVLGDRFIFSVLDPQTSTRRLWSSDGTWDGTRALGTPPFPFGPPRLGFPVLGEIEDRGLLLFSAFEEQSARLWVTDGTPGGTRALGRNGPDGWPSQPEGFVRGDAPVVFEARTPSLETVLWTTDGSEAGTRRVNDPTVGEGFSQFSSFRQLDQGPTLFFRSVDFGTVELWASDGLPQGTRKLRTLTSGHASQVLLPMIVAESSAYFIGRDLSGTRQIWRSNGTPQGTRPVSSFSYDAFQSLTDYTGRIAAVGDTVYFAANSTFGFQDTELWSADSSGARRVADICPGTCSSEPRWLQEHDGALYFQADDGASGAEMWISDGTAAGTRRLADACPGQCDSHSFTVGSSQGRVFFRSGASNPADAEMWVSEGTAASTRKITDFLPADPFPSLSRVPFSVAAVDGFFLFTADDGDAGWEVWRSDGSVAGTQTTLDIFPGQHPGAGSYPQKLIPLDDGVLFFARAADEIFQPWFSDGTIGGTRELGPVATEPTPHSTEAPYSMPVAVGDRAHFLFLHELGAEWWQVPPQGAPQRLVRLPGQLPFRDWPIVAVDSGTVLLQSAPTGGGLWITDGTEQGTRLLRSMAVGSEAAVLNGKAYFSGGDDANSPPGELWTTDGTQAGTQAFPGGGEQIVIPEELTVLGDRILFSGLQPGTGSELWATDGTSAGTEMLVEIVPGVQGGAPNRLTVSGSRVFFFTFEPGGVKLWVSDGTSAGTRRVAPAPPAVLPEDEEVIAAVGERLFWIAPALGDQREVWTSDGTATGTRSLGGLIPGRPERLGSFGDRVVVSTVVPSSGQELWETDGTFPGTRRLLDLTGPYPSMRYLVESGSRLFFQGTDLAAGTELLALAPNSPEPCVADDETLCLLDGRFAVKVRWYDHRSATRGVGHAVPFPGSSRTGLFWFFDDENIELVVKSLDATSVNGWFWTFYGALSDVEYWIEVTDTVSGRVHEYHNPAGNLCGRGDTSSFPATEEVLNSGASPVLQPPTAASGATGSACGGGPEDLCLLDDRFRVEVSWRDQRSGDTGVGTAIPGTEKSGYFWFFSGDNVELVVKILDGRALNGRFWVFYGALSDVEYTLTVTDTETGEQLTYTNPPGEICGRGDTTAF